MKNQATASAIVDAKPANTDQLAECWRQVHAYVTSHHGGVDADDVTQETVILAWQHRLIRCESLDDQVFANADRIARSSRIADTERPRIRELPESPEECLIAKAEHDIVRNVVRTEKPRLKTVLISQFWHRESYTEYSEREGITEKAARQRKHRALKSVRRKFELACRVIIPLTAVLTSIRQLGAKTTHASATTTAGTTPLAIAAGLGLVIAVSGDDVPGGRGGESPHRTASVSITDVSSSRGSPTPGVPDGQRTTAPPSPAERQRPLTSTPPDSTPRDDPAPRVWHQLQVSPGTGPGRQQHASIGAETLIGPVTAGEESDATGPAMVDFLCSGSTSRCRQASPLNVDP